MIGHLLTDTIYIASTTGVDSDGEFTYGAAAAADAKVQPKDEESASTSGQVVRYTAELITTTQIKRGDRIWLPGEDQTNNDLAHTPAVVQAATGIGSGATVYSTKL